MKVKLNKSLVLGTGVIGRLGEVVDVDAGIAKQFIASGAAQETNEDDQQHGADLSLIIEIIKSFDPDDKTLWTNKGKPTTEAIEAELGGEISVSAAQRDAAWKQLQQA